MVQQSTCISSEWMTSQLHLEFHYTGEHQHLNVSAISSSVQHNDDINISSARHISWIGLRRVLLAAMEQNTAEGQPMAKAQQSGNAHVAKKEKGPSKLKKLWDKAGLDHVTLILMLKGSLPPIIALAM